MSLLFSSGKKITTGRPTSEEIGHHIALQSLQHMRYFGGLDRHTREHRLDSIEEDGEG